MANAWDVRLGVEGGDLPSQVCGVSDRAVLMGLVDQAAEAVAGGAFLVSVRAQSGVGWAMLYGCPWGWSLGLQDDFGPGVSDVFTTLGRVDAGEAWDFARLFGQELDWQRRYFTDPRRVRPALAAYLSTRKLWPGVSWEPEPDPVLLVAESVAGRVSDAELGAAPERRGS